MLTIGAGIAFQKADPQINSINTALAKFQTVEQKKQYLYKYFLNKINIITNEIRYAYNEKV